jgi:hypothetical protein
LKRENLHPARDLHALQTILHLLRLALRLSIGGLPVILTSFTKDRPCAKIVPNRVGTIQQWHPLMNSLIAARVQRCVQFVRKRAAFGELHEQFSVSG